MFHRRVEELIHTPIGILLVFSLLEVLRFGLIRSERLTNSY
jgi:hypothetical protein